MTLRLDPAALAPSGSPALVGVSGGCDSMALLHALASTGHQGLHVCHFDHGWRAESREDAAFVRAAAEKLSLPFHSAAASGLPRTEATAREARYQFFADIAQATGIAWLYLAHHADDQVETFLHNLLRGAGAGGLRGMRPLTERNVSGVDLRIARPLLGCWRTEIDQYIASQGVAFREDASNASPDHTRNRLRHTLLPEMARIMGRPVHAALWRAATTFAAEDALLHTLAQAAMPAVEALTVSTLRAQPLALQRRIIHRWLQQHAIPLVGFAEVEAVRSRLEYREPAKVNLPGDHHARRRAGVIFLERPPAA